MSINLGNDGIAAIRDLRTHPAFASFVQALAEVTNKRANAALDAPTEHVQRAAGYAAAMRDLHTAIESAATNTPQAQVKKPGPVKE